MQIVVLLFIVVALGCADEPPQDLRTSQPPDMGVSEDTGEIADDVSIDDVPVDAGEEARLAELVIEPAELVLEFGSTLRLDVTGLDQNSDPYPLSSVNYATDDEDVATVTSNGVLIGEAIGDTTLSVESEGVVAEREVRITGRPIARIEIRPTEMNLDPGDRARISVDLFDEFNQWITDPREVTFASADEAVATVDDMGFVTAVAAGMTTVTVSVAEFEESVQISVMGAEITGIEVTPPNDNLIWQEAVQLDASLSWDQDPPATTPSITWSSSDTSVATVDANGLVSAVATGSATITASVAGFDDTTSINVDFSLDSIDAGAAHACALMSGAAICWGDNRQGQLGAAGGPGPIKLDHGRTYSDIATGGDNTCAIDDSTGQVWCWGSNSNLQLGNTMAPATSSSTPIQIEELGIFRVVEVGSQVACGIKTSDELWCWGRASSGMLGNGQTTPDRATPVLVGTYRAVAVGGDHVCAIDSNDEADCWGRNDEGQIGLNTTSMTPVTTPTAVTGGFTFGRISLGQNHSCGNTPNGTLLCWGDDSAGQVGDAGGPGAPTPLLTPSPVPLNRVVAGGDHSCALDLSGALYCWGSHISGAIAIMTTNDILKPTATNAGLNFSRITMGEVFACGLVAGVPYCWGDGSNGALAGAASTTTPSRISPF